MSDKTAKSRTLPASDEILMSWDELFSTHTLHECYRILPDGRMQLGGYEVIIKPDGTRIETEPHWNLTATGPSRQFEQFAKSAGMEKRV